MDEVRRSDEWALGLLSCLIGRLAAFRGRLGGKV
ncbi:IPTL-CTERM sorting domain-containing protein [Limosilactobacillus mucosae]